MGCAMAKICILGTSTVLSYAFWWGADALGSNLLAAFTISSVGAIVGCVVGWKIYQRYLE